MEARAGSFAPRLIALSACVKYPDTPQALSSLCQEAAPWSVAIVIRDREQTVSSKLKWARDVAASAAELHQWLLVADRLDVARVLGATGVHLGTGALLPSRLARCGLVLCRTGHGLLDLSEQELDGLQAALVSPVFAPRKGNAALGEQGLRQRLAEIRSRAPNLKTYALGGVTAENAEIALRAGAFGVAAIESVTRRGSRQALLEALGILRS